MSFSSIMQTHIVPVDGQEQAYLRTGYEYVLPYRVSKEFAYMALQDGKVTLKTADKLVIEFKDKTTEKVRIGNISSRSEGGSSIPSEIVTDLNKGDRFKAGDPICYNTSFFEKDILDDKKIVYKHGSSVNTLLTDNTHTYEDSCVISDKVMDKLRTNISKEKTFTIRADQNIYNLVKTGDKVENDTVLFIVEDAVGGSVLDADNVKLLKKLTGQAPKAKVKGTISNIDVIYNCDTDKMSKTVKELVSEADKRTKRVTGKNITNRVDATYSLKGKAIPEDTIVIKVYISAKTPMGAGDKAIFSNQLKTTVAEVMKYPMTTEAGNDIEAIFGYTSIQARVVVSPELIGTTSSILHFVGKEAVRLFKK